MKVLLVTTSYPDFPGSQRGIFIRKLCLELLKNGLEISVLTPKVLSQSRYLEDDSGIRVYRFWFPSSGRQLNQMDAVPVFPMALYMLSGLFKTLQLIVRERPHVIHGNWIVPTGLIAAVAGRFLGVPVLNTAHGMDLRISERQPIRALFDLAVKLSGQTVIVSPSMRSREVLRECEIIPMGVDEVFFGIHPARRSKTIVYTRSLEPVYDAETLIRSVPVVAGSVPDVRVIIAGSGSQEERLKALARQMGADSHMEFLGHVPSEVIPDLLKQAAVYVSTAVADGTSPALLEAIAAGLTPVVTDIDANRPLVTDGHDGFLFEARNHNILAEKIILAASGVIQEAELERKRQEMKDSISWASIADRFMSCYQKLATS